MNIARNIVHITSFTPEPEGKSGNLLPGGWLTGLIDTECSEVSIIPLGHQPGHTFHDLPNGKGLNVILTQYTAILSELNTNVTE